MFMLSKTTYAWINLIHASDKYNLASWSLDPQVESVKHAVVRWGSLVTTGYHCKAIHNFIDGFSQLGLILRAATVMNAKVCICIYFEEIHKHNNVPVA